MSITFLTNVTNNHVIVSQSATPSINNISDYTILLIASSSGPQSNSGLMNKNGSTFRFRIVDGNGNIESRRSFSTTPAVQYSTNGPLSQSNSWVGVATTLDSTTKSIKIYYGLPGTGSTATECSYEPTSASTGNGNLNSDSVGDWIWGNNPQGTIQFSGSMYAGAYISGVLSPTAIQSWFNDPVGTTFTSSIFVHIFGAKNTGSIPDISGNGLSGSIFGSPIMTPTGSLKSYPLATKTRTFSVGSSGRDFSDIPRMVSQSLDGWDLQGANWRMVYDFYPDSIFDVTSSIIFSNFKADPYSTSSLSRCVVFRAASGSEHNLISGSGVIWRRTTAPTTSEYAFDNDVPGMSVENIALEYTGGTVAADNIQLRAFRINHGARGQSQLQGVWCRNWNTGRPGASIIGLSLPGGIAYDCVVTKTGVGQSSGSTRNFSAAPSESAALGPVGFYNCTSVSSGGDGFRWTANGASITASIHNCIDSGSIVGYWNEAVSVNGTVVATNNISSDATADDFGGTGHQINVSSSQFVDASTGNIRLIDGSVAIGAGSYIPSGSHIDILLYDYSANLTPDVGAAQWRSSAPSVIRRRLTYLGQKLIIRYR